MESGAADGGRRTTGLSRAVRAGSVLPDWIWLAAGTLGAAVAVYGTVGDVRAAPRISELRSDGKLICAPICLQWFTRANWRRFGGTFLFNPAAPEIRLISAPICLQWFTRTNWRRFGGTFLFNPAAPEIRLKHAPPMRRSRLEMAKHQVRAAPRMHKAEPYEIGRAHV